MWNLWPTQINQCMGNTSLSRHPFKLENITLMFQIVCLVHFKLITLSINQTYDTNNVLRVWLDSMHL